MSKELKLCPCCDGKAQIIAAVGCIGAITTIVHVYYYQGHCLGCGLKSQKHSTIEGAVNIWNRRPK